MDAWSLVSTVVVPGFDWRDFTLGDRDELERSVLLRRSAFGS